MISYIKQLYHLINEASFYLNGKKPWKRGYVEYKKRHIRHAIIANPFSLKQLPPKYGFRLDERIVEYPWLFSRLPSKATGKLLDAGSALNFDYLLNHETLKTKKVFISTLAPEAACYWRSGLSYVYEDLRSSCFRDEYFDWIVSLSTIEHIGLDNTLLYTGDLSKNEQNGTSYLAAIGEYKRMLKKGGVLYLSFPFGRNENHGWFQIFDETMIDELVTFFNPSDNKEFHYKYESEGWRESSREESHGATYFDIHTQNKYDPDFAAASRAIACLELTK